MTSSVKLKEAFEAESKHGAFYTGGNVEWHNSSLYCQTLSIISIIDIETGTVTSKIGNEASEEDSDTIQTFTSDGERIVTSHKSGLLKLWKNDNTLEKMWKYIHKGPIARLQLNGDILASGGADGVVRIWDLVHHACILSCKDCSGVVNLVEFHPKNDMLLASGDDGKICEFDLESGQTTNMYNGHFSKVTSVAFGRKGIHFVSAGRDKVLILWKLGTTTALKTIPVYEGLESLVGLPKKFTLPNFKSGSGIYVATGGENGVIRVWDVQNAKEVYAQTNSLVSKAKDEGGLAITKLVVDAEFKSIGIVSVEQNIILHNFETFDVVKQFIGFTDEILDVVFCGQNDSHLAIATNSNDIKLYENSTMNCNLLKGHTDLVLALNKAPFKPNLIISSGKDNSVRVWDIESLQCLAVGLRHTASVGSVAFGNSSKFAVSVSQDTCLKLWNIPETFTDTNLECLNTQVAHTKDVNCVAVAPNDKLIATCSQDKTAKLWTNSLTPLGTLKGHRRGVWCVRFSPTDQVLLTSSADCSVKLWSIAQLNCLKTISGHEASVLRAEFITSGLQILTAGADGLVKLFNLKTGECTTTFDEHEARIWSLTINKNESGFATGGSDSTLIKWKDVTEAKRLERIKEEEQLALEDQQLQNYIHENNLLKALKLALKLERPFQVLKIVQGVLKQNNNALSETIKALRNDQKEALLKAAVEWNTNSRHCQAAQLVLNVLISELQTGDFRPVGLASTIEAALPYTERHFKRTTQLMQDLHYITYTINCMQPHAKIN